MNIEFELSAAVAKVALRTKMKDDLITRVCRVTFTREFDGEIAAAIGGEAPKAREALQGLGLEKVVIPTTALLATGKLRFVKKSPKKGEPDEKDTVTIKNMRGVKAVATVGKKEDDPPQIALSFDFNHFDGAWTFLGRHHAAWVDLSLKSEQTVLSFVEPKPLDDGYLPKPGEAF